MSRRGRCRVSNQDRTLSDPPLFAIADGVGGGRAGEVAAALAVDALGRGDSVAINPAVLLRAGFATADADIRRAAAEQPECAGMSTTLTAAMVAPEGLTLCNVGDSRAYLYRGGCLRQLTRDHSLVAELLRRRALTPDQAARHRLRSVITRCLGAAVCAAPDLYPVRAQPADVYLLCSDGLSDQVADERIAGILARSGNLWSVARDLVAAADAAGGHDNATVVLFRLGSASTERMLTGRSTGSPRARPRRGRPAPPRRGG